MVSGIQELRLNDESANLNLRLREEERVYS